MIHPRLFLPAGGKSESRTDNGFGCDFLALAGYSSTPIKVDTGIIHARTFNLVYQRSQPELGFADEAEGVHERLQAAVPKRLAAEGVIRAATPARPVLKQQL